MSGNTLKNLDCHSSDYCSQLRSPLPDIKSIEEGILVFQGILERTILCNHDVKQLNFVYDVIDHFEKKKGVQIEPGEGDLIPQDLSSRLKISSKADEHSSNEVLDLIIEKIQKIASERNIAGLISLYHLQNFSYKGLQIDEHFKALWNFTKNETIIKNIANYLPCCGKEIDFVQDVSNLIGSDPSVDVAKILDRKKQMQNIGIRKLELNALRQNTPHLFPKYLEELLDGGYIHLYDHLIKLIMNPDKSQSILKEMTCSLQSFVVLDTKEAIIKKVEKSITKSDSKVLFLIGNQKVGKSTTFCFLKGDEMELDCDRYQSKDDQNQLIREGKSELFFLPSIFEVNEGFIVDFPGLDHSGDELISLGIECSLKALIEKFDSKCLVLDSILEQNRFDATSRLAVRLNRILSNKSDCVLGITKYAQDPHFNKIKKIEEEKKEEKLLPTEEESKLIGRIKRCPLEARKKELQQDLEKMQNDRLAKPHPETVKSWEELEKKENQLLKEAQLILKIRLDHLNDPILAPSYREILFTTKSISLNSVHILDSYIEKHLTHDFKEKLKIELENGEGYKVKYENFKDFEQKIRETSLINVFLSVSNPEIGKFLHLEEMDPNIVRLFDREIANSCMEKCLQALMCEVNVSLIKKMLVEVKDEVPELYVKLDNFLQIFTNYILDLQAVPYENNEQAEIGYNRIRDQYLKAQEEAGKKYEYPVWANVLFGFLLGIPIGINQLMKWQAQKEAKRIQITNEVNYIYDQINKKYELLMDLKKIQIITMKNSEVNEAMNSGVISTHSIKDLCETLSTKIRIVRAAYGTSEWDARIKFLANRVTLTPYDRKSKTHFARLLDYACLIIGLESPFKIEQSGLWSRGEVIESKEITIRSNSLPELINFKELCDEEVALNRLMYVAALLEFHAMDNFSWK